MAILPLVIAPDPRLQRRSVEVTEVNDQIRQLGKDMLDTMYYDNGIGLAAVQVGAMVRVIVVDVLSEDRKNPDPNNQYIMINPVVLWASEETDCFSEGCLSFPGEHVDITRPRDVRVEYLDINGEKRILEITGMFAKCVQHEIDHSNGITLETHASPMKRDIMKKRLTKRKKTNA